MDDSYGGTITGVFEIDHRVPPSDLGKPGGFDPKDIHFIGAVLVYCSVVRGGNTSCHCYTLELPMKIHPLVDFNEWSESLRGQGVVVESFVAGWRDALGASHRFGKPITTDTLPPYILCADKGGRRYRFPTLRAPSSNKIVRALRGRCTCQVMP